MLMSLGRVPFFATSVDGQRRLVAGRCVVVLLVLISSLAVVGCSEEPAVVAQVGDVELTRADYELFVGNARGKVGAQQAAAGQNVQVQYLQSMVDQELLLLEARDRRIEEELAVANELAFLARRRLAELFQARGITPTIEITQADLEREFVDSQLDRERLLSRILVRTPEDRDRVLAGLSEGRSFAEVLTPFAPNDAIAEGDGVVGWFNYADAERRFQIPRRVFFSLAEGQMAEPVHLPRGWQVFRFLNERKPELADYQQEVQRLVQQRQWKARNAEELELLKSQFAAQTHPQALELFVGRLRESTIHAATFSAAEGQTALYSFAGGAMDLNTAVAMLRAQGLSGPPPPSAAGALFEDLLFKPLLFELAAREKGWDQEAEFIIWYEQQRKKVLLNTLMAAETKAKIQVNDAEVEAFYEGNKERFRTMKRVDIRELAANTAEAAAEFRQQLEAGTPIGQLLIRRDAETHGKPRTGEMTLHQILKSRYPVLVEAAFAAEEGDWVGPVETDDGHFAVFEVLAVRDAEVEPFDKVRSRVEALLRQQRENELIGRFISRLRGKYADRVVLYPDRLALDEES